MSGRFESVTGRLPACRHAGQTHRVYVEEAGAGHSPVVPAHGGSGYAPVPRSVERRANPERLSRARVRPAVHRQVVGSLRMAACGLQLSSRDYLDIT